MNERDQRNGGFPSNRPGALAYARSTADALPQSAAIELSRVLRNTYSVPTGLIGHTIKVRIHEWHLEVG